MSEAQSCPSIRKWNASRSEQMVYVVRTFRLGSILSGYQTVGIYDDAEVAVCVADDEFYSRDKQVGCLVEAFKLNHYYGVKRGQIIYRIDGETIGSTKV